MTHSKRLQAYVNTALWSSIGDDDQPMDRDYEIDDLAPETIATMQADLDRFFTTLESTPDDDRTLLDVALEYADSSVRDNDPYGTICHDFWLTRNGHGCGFWDGDYGHVGGKLTEIAKGFGSCDLYVGDDGQIMLIV